MGCQGSEDNVHSKGGGAEGVINSVDVMRLSDFEVSSPIVMISLFKHNNANLGMS